MTKTSAVLVKEPWGWVCVEVFDTYEEAAKRAAEIDRPDREAIAITRETGQTGQNREERNDKNVWKNLFQNLDN